MAGSATCTGTRRENNATAGTNDITKTKFATLTPDASYTTGGDTYDCSAIDAGASISPADEFTELWGCSVVGRTVVDADKELIPIIDAAGAPASLKVMVVEKSTGAQTAATTDNSGEVIQVRLEGN